jgi:hypothetical protein
MARGETGFETLRQSSSVPDCDAVRLNSWADTLKIVEDLRTTNHESVVLDALGGFERLCHEHVCARDFDNVWGEKGFQAYMRGYDVAIADWQQLIVRMDELRSIRNVNIILLAHSKIKTFKNPLGPDFDRYVPDCHEKTWGVTHKWADAVLFGNYISVTRKDKGRDKGIGGTERVIYCDRTDAYDAKNRYGMPSMLTMSVGPADMWKTVWAAINPNAAGAAPEL